MGVSTSGAADPSGVAGKKRSIMKEETIKSIMGGTPLEVLTKAGLAALALLWGNLETIGLAAFGYFILLLIDGIYGARLAVRAGLRFSATKFTKGIMGKFILTALFMCCTAVFDTVIPDYSWLSHSPVFYGSTALIFAWQLIDVAKKYSTLSDSKMANWIEAKLGSFVKYDEPKNP